MEERKLRPLESSYKRRRKSFYERMAEDEEGGDLDTIREQDEIVFNSRPDEFVHMIESQLNSDRPHTVTEAILTVIGLRIDASTPVLIRP